MKFKSVTQQVVGGKVVILTYAVPTYLDTTTLEAFFNFHFNDVINDHSRS
jgi:hypothetical protein